MFLYVFTISFVFTGIVVSGVRQMNLPEDAEESLGSSLLWQFGGIEIRFMLDYNFCNRCLAIDRL